MGCFVSNAKNKSSLQDMQDIIKYDGSFGSVHFSDEDNLHGGYPMTVDIIADQ
jgi:hypothetical protein